MDTQLRTHLSAAISAATGQPFTLAKQRSVGGGCINSAYIIQDSNGSAYFVKTNSLQYREMFEAEAAGLNEILHSQTILAPRPILCGGYAQSAYLVLEYLDLNRPSAANMKTFGTQLAQMHKVTAKQYGWHIDNTIGSTPQINQQSSSWLEFWREYRLAFQLKLAQQNGYRGRIQKQGEQLLNNLDVLLDGHRPVSSLLHGDLWSGNCAVSNNMPTIFDPAVYYGDREADIAMTELFGGFSTQFYDAYNAHYPLDDKYSQRKILYNLYHVLNHLNLFGGGYLAQAERMLDSLNAI